MNRVMLATCGSFLVFACVIGAVYYTVQAQQSQTELIPVVADYRHLVSEVNISGTTEAADTLDLAFADTGIVESVPVVVGQSVATGTVLMTIRGRTLSDRLAQAQANLSAELAKLANIENGTRPEQVAVTGAELTSNRATLSAASQGLVAALQTAENVVDVTIRFTVDKYIHNPTTSNPSLILQPNDYQLALSLVNARRAIQSTLVEWNTRADTLTKASSADLLSASTAMHAYLQDTLDLLSQLTRVLAVNDSTLYSADRSAIASARTSITTANDVLMSAEKSVQDAQSSLSITTQRLGLDTSGPTAAAVSAQRAAVSGARAQVSEVQHTLLDQSIVAPRTGVITSIAVKQGEVAVAGRTAISMIAEGQLKIEGYVPEIHVSEIANNQPVRIQLNSFPEEIFTGVLGYIDPIAVPRDGVPNIKVTVYLTRPDARIIPGLTANAFIQTADKEKALTIPVSAVTRSSSETSVFRLVGNIVEKVQVALGSVGTDGYVEVVSGLAVGDQVIVDQTKQYRIVPN